MQAKGSYYMENTKILLPIKVNSVGVKNRNDSVDIPRYIPSSEAR